MNVQIILAPPGSSGVYTNLDTVSGKVVLRLPKAGNITQVVVKLEGESNSVLEEEGIAGDRGRSVASEKHRIVYKVERVFPTPAMLNPIAKSFALQAGTHEYPFSFKVCSIHKSWICNLLIGFVVTYQ
jgi:hypothetical protein